MQINIIWDSSTSSAPAAFISAVNYVVQLFDQMFTDPITVNIAVGWGEVNGSKLVTGALGESETNGDYFSYSTVRNALISHATSADDLSGTSFLPVASPVGNSSFFVASAQEKALGLMAANSNVIDGWMGLSKTAPWDFSPTGAVPGGQYYLVGVIEHELTEDLGRIAGLSPFNGYTIMDLFRYSANGTRIMTASSRSRAYFSVDNGKTDLGDWNIISGGDRGDWAANMAPDALLAFSSSGVLNGFSQADQRLMDVLGFTLSGSSSTPPPVTYSLSPNPASVNENGGLLTLTVTRSSGTSAGTVYVSTVADQGFVNNSNYTNLNAQAVNFTAGQMTATVSIAINDLGLTSGSESFRAVVLQNSTDPTSAAVASDVFTIVNNDIPPSVTYLLSPNPASVNENAGTLTLTVTRSSSTSAGTVYVSTVADQGFANSGNYTNLNAQAVNFTAGQTTATVSITINDLGLTSGSENYRAVVLPTAGSPTSAAVASDVFTIVNNDVAPPPVTYSLSPNPASVNENAGMLTLTVTRSSSTSAGTVYVSTVADQGFANSGNYTNLNALAVNFTAGQATATVSIAINDLGLTSGSESYRAVVLPTAGSPTSAAVASDVFTIMNNDVATPPPSNTFSLSPNPAKVNESGKSITFTLTRTDTSTAQTVYASTLTDQGYANNGNFKPLSNLAVTFAAGQATASVSVIIVDLGLTSGLEAYRLIVTQTPSAPASAAVASDTFTIINNDFGSGGGKGSLSLPSIPDLHGGFWHSGQHSTGSALVVSSFSLASGGSSLLGSPNELIKRTPSHFGTTT
jgi:oxalate decarboxylase/phosphoglucose isomerase-like protein (cupin superfamily)